MYRVEVQCGRGWKFYAVVCSAGEAADIVRQHRANGIDARYCPAVWSACASGNCGE
jgi:hypothetical protein